MNQFWQENFGYGIDKLTQSEAGHLRRAASVDEIRDRLVKARYEGIERLGKKGIKTPLRSERGESAKRTEVSSVLEQNYRETLGSYTRRNTKIAANTTIAPAIIFMIAICFAARKGISSAGAGREPECSA